MKIIQITASCDQESGENLYALTDTGLVLYYDYRDKVWIHLMSRKVVNLSTDDIDSDIDKSI